MSKVWMRPETFLGLGCWLLLALPSTWCWASSQDLTLNTRDGVKLGITYYPSSKGKEAVPIVILHDFKESRSIYQSFAASLQASRTEDNTRAVVTVDLRGHGESTVQSGGGGRTRELDPTRLTKRDYELMVTQDLAAVRRFLVEKNNRGELNLNALCLVGAGMGANVAAYWSASDWAWPELASLKQGQDVKALVLASPEWGFRGLPLLKPLRQPGFRDRVSFLIVYGERSGKAKKDAMNVHKNLAKFHPEPPRDKIKELKDLFLIGLPTKLQGTRLLTNSEFGMEADVDAFIDARVTSKHFKWVSREK